MKKIRFQPNVPAELRAINQREAMGILQGIHRYAATGAGRVKPLSGQLMGYSGSVWGITGSCLKRRLRPSRSTALVPGGTSIVSHCGTEKQTSRERLYFVRNSRRKNFPVAVFGGCQLRPRHEER